MTTPPAATELPVDVVVPCWGDYSRFLDGCLDSIPGDVASIVVVGDADALAVASRRGVPAVAIGSGPTPARGRARGLGVGSAPFVCTIDADDRFLPGGLACLVDLLRVDGSAVAASGALRGTKPGHVWPPRGWAWTVCRPGGGPVLLARNGLAAVGACVIRRSAVADPTVLFPDLADEDWHAAVALRAIGRVVRTGRPVVRYDVRAGSVSRRPRDPAVVAASHDALLATALGAGARPRSWWRLVEVAAAPFRRRRQRSQERRWGS